jgi:uncharacterized integral membrane protein
VIPEMGDQPPPSPGVQGGSNEERSDAVANPLASDATPPGGASTEKNEPEPERSLAEVAKARRRRAAKALGALAVFVILLLFIVWNAQAVEVNFLVVKSHPRLIWVMVTCAVLGGVLGYLLGRPGHEAKPKKKGGTA